MFIVISIIISSFLCSFCIIIHSFIVVSIIVCYFCLVCLCLLLLVLLVVLYVYVIVHFLLLMLLVVILSLSFMLVVLLLVFITTCSFVSFFRHYFYLFFSLGAGGVPRESRRPGGGVTVTVNDIMIHN